MRSPGNTSPEALAIFSCSRWKAARTVCVRILDGVKLFSYVPNIGDARSLIVDPANITHREVPESYRKAAGVSDDLIRLSIGLEDAGDLMADLDRAIAGAYGE